MKKVLILVCTLSLCPAARAQSSDISTLSWMRGCWLATSGSAEVEETWTPAKGGTMMGLSRTVRNDRTTATEFLIIRQVEGELVYTAVPSGQVTTDFTASHASMDMFRVENPDHDFPQKIEYERLGRDSIIARVFGNVSDAEPAFRQDFSRIECN